MNTAHQLVVFWLGRHRFALPLAIVRRVVRAVEVTPVPKAPQYICGVIDVQGEVIAVLDVRSRLGLLPRPIGLADHLLIARTADRTLALIVDQVDGLAPAHHSKVAHSRAEAPWLGQFQGVAQLEDGLVLIQDLEKFLSPAEALALDKSLEGVH